MIVYLAELVMINWASSLRINARVLSNSASRKLNSMHISSTAKPTPATASASRRRSYVKFFQARGVRTRRSRLSKQIRGIGGSHLAQRRQARDGAHGDAHRQHSQRQLESQPHRNSRAFAGDKIQRFGDRPTRQEAEDREDQGLRKHD